MNFQTIIDLLTIGLLGGCTMVIVVLIAIRNKNKCIVKEETKVVLEEKPKFSVRKAKDNEKTDIQVLIASFKCIEDNIDEIQYIYDKKLAEDKDIVFNDYIFENIGKTSVKEFSVIMNETKYFSILEYSKRKSYFESKVKSYYVTYDKAEIAVGETIRLRVYRHKDEKFPSYTRAGLSIFFTDKNGNYWEQPFFSGEVKLYSPYQIEKYHMLIAKGLDPFEY